MNELKLRNRQAKNGRVKLIELTLNQYNMLIKQMGGVRFICEHLTVITFWLGNHSNGDPFQQ